MKRSSGLLVLIALGSLVASGCYTTAPTGRTSEDILQASEGHLAQNIPIEVASIPLDSPSDKIVYLRKTLAFRVDTDSIPPSTRVVKAVLRLRLARGRKDDSGAIVSEWRPQLYWLRKGINVQEVRTDKRGDLRILKGAVTTDLGRVWGRLQSGKSGLSYTWGITTANVGGLQGSEVDVSYLALVKEWSSTVAANVRQNGLWIELDITSAFQNSHRDGIPCLIVADGEVSTFSEESYYSPNALPAYLRPQAHVEFVYESPGKQ